MPNTLNPDSFTHHGDGNRDDDHGCGCTLRRVEQEGEVGAVAGDTQAEGSTLGEVGGDRQVEEDSDTRVVVGKGDRPVDVDIVVDAEGIADKDWARGEGRLEVERAAGTDAGYHGWAAGKT